MPVAACCNSITDSFGAGKDGRNSHWDLSRVPINAAYDIKQS